MKGLIAVGGGLLFISLAWGIAALRNFIDELDELGRDKRRDP